MGLITVGNLISAMFTSPETHDYPQSGLKLTDASRGQIGIENGKCTLCRLCERRCPAGAIRADRKKCQWLINRTVCVACTECIDQCPENCLYIIKEYTEAEASAIIDVYPAEAVAGSDKVLEGIEMPQDNKQSIKSRKKRLIKCRCRKI